MLVVSEIGLPERKPILTFSPGVTINESVLHLSIVSHSVNDIAIARASTQATKSPPGVTLGLGRVDQKANPTITLRITTVKVTNPLLDNLGNPLSVNTRLLESTLDFLLLISFIVG